MAAKFFALLTVRGSEKLASATALGTQLKLTHMAVGDGNGSLPTPTASQTALLNEKRRAAINSLTVDPLNPSQIIAEQIIPEDEGGFWIREIGVFDDAGELIAIANCAETYKPVLAEGSGRTQVIRMVLIVSSTDAVTLKIDPSVVLATRKYVDDQTIIVKAYADDLMAKHLAAADPHTQYAPKASPTLTGTPKAPTAAAGTSTTQLATTAFVTAADNLKANIASPTFTGTPTAPTAAATVNTTQIATTAFVKTAIANLVASAPDALDTLNELAAALGNDANFATTMTNALALKAPLDSPTFTGTPAAPTAAAGTSSTQLATTAFVTAADNLKAPLASPALTGTPTAPTAATATNNTQIATTAFVKTNISTLAPLASPTFTGTPTAPTAAATVNTTQIATTAFVKTAIANLVASAPDALDTLNELAAALGNDANFATTMTSALALKAPLDSPTFTGTPAAPTAAVGTSSTQLATTAFVTAADNLKAPLASPALTGTPTAPTAATATNNTQIATTAFVKTNISTLAPLASPTFTGTPAAPTPAAGDSTTKVATTAFVANAITAANGRLINVQRITSSGTYTPTAGTKFIVVEQQAPGGNGANAPATASGYVASGPGGGSGAYTMFKVLLSDIVSYDITIGTVAAASNSATQAGSSSFCGVTCSGGLGPAVASSQANTSVVQSKGAGGGVVTNAGTTTLTMLVSCKGNDGGNSLATVAGNALSGIGAPSYLYGSSSAIGGGSGAGVAGVDGSGGSGANSAAYTTSGLTGGQGGNGVTIIWEYA